MARYVNPFKNLAKTLGATKETIGVAGSIVNSVGSKIKALPFTTKLTEFKDKLIAMVTKLFERFKEKADEVNKDVAKTKQKQLKKPEGKQDFSKVTEKADKATGRTNVQEKLNDVSKTIAAASPSKGQALAGPVAGNIEMPGKDR